MKKTVFIGILTFTTTCFINCSHSKIKIEIPNNNIDKIKDEATNSSENINPPPWIQGQWQSTTNATTTLIFSNDNIIYSTTKASLDFKEFSINNPTSDSFTIKEAQNNLFYTIIIIKKINSRINEDIYSFNKTNSNGNLNLSFSSTKNGQATTQKQNLFQKTKGSLATLIKVRKNKLKN